MHRNVSPCDSKKYAIRPSYFVMVHDQHKVSDDTGCFDVKKKEIFQTEKQK